MNRSRRVDCALQRSLTNATQTNHLKRGRRDIEMASILALCTRTIKRVLYRTLFIVQLVEQTGNAPVPLSSFEMARAEQVYS